MASTFWKIASLSLRLFITLFTPLILFSGVMLFNANDLYIWYMVHYKSLCAAVASFSCIVVLYVLAIPVALSLLDPPQEHCEVHEPMGHDEHHITDEDRAIKTLLALALKQQAGPKVRAEAPEREDFSSYITQLNGIRGLQETNVLSNEEYENLKAIIVGKMIKHLNGNEEIDDS